MGWAPRRIFNDVAYRLSTSSAMYNEKVEILTSLAKNLIAGDWDTLDESWEYVDSWGFEWAKDALRAAGFVGPTVCPSCGQDIL